jgi:two-component system, cell cycle sensor histidine kinase DivJ
MLGATSLSARPSPRPPGPRLTPAPAHTPEDAAATAPRLFEGQGVVAWHGGWAAAVAVATVLALTIDRPAGTAAFGALAMIAPGLGGLALLRRDGPGERSLVLVGWTLAALAALVLSGGLSGPLVAFAVMPFVAGIALGGPRHGVRLTQAGAAGSAIAALAGQFSAWWIGPPEPRYIAAGVFALIAAGAAVLAVRLSWRVRERVLLQAETEAERVRGFLDALPGLTLVMDPTGRVVADYGAPPPALDLAALRTGGLMAAVHAPDRTAVLAAIDAALAGQEAQVVFAPRQALDRRVSLALRQIGGGDSAPLVVAQAFDATRQFAIEVGLEAARAEAEARDAGKTRFLANMSHELRTPLNAVIGFSDVMRQRLFGPLPLRYAEYAESIHQAGGHLLELIGDVLDVAKIEAERYELSREVFDARDAVSAAVALVRVTAADKGVTLSSLLPDEAVTVDADRRALKQITLNLLSNAIKFTPSGGSVTLTLETIGPYLELVVADTGVGIAKKDLKRLGRPFEQAGGADQKAQGTGLGLSLVRALAELHSGRMSLDSTLGEGTAVTVRMPVARTERPAPSETGAEIVPLNAG